MVATKEEVKKLVEEWFFYFRSAGIPANEAAAQAVRCVQNGETSPPPKIDPPVENLPGNRTVIVNATVTSSDAEEKVKEKRDQIIPPKFDTSKELPPPPIVESSPIPQRTRRPRYDTQVTVVNTAESESPDGREYAEYESFVNDAVEDDFEAANSNPVDEIPSSEALTDPLGANIVEMMKTQESSDTYPASIFEFYDYFKRKKLTSLRTLVRTVFSCPKTLALSFRLDDNEESDVTDINSHDWDGLLRIYEVIDEHPLLEEAVRNSITILSCHHCFSENWKPFPVGYRVVALLKLLLNPYLGNESYFERTLPAICNLFADLSQHDQEIIVEKLSVKPKTNLSAIVQNLQQFVTFRVFENAPDKLLNDDLQIESALKTLRLVFFASLVGGARESANLNSEIVDISSATSMTSSCDSSILTIPDEGPLSRLRRSDSIQKLDNQIADILRGKLQTDQRIKNIQEDPLAKAFNVDWSIVETPLIPYSDFINPQINKKLEIDKDYVNYKLNFEDGQKNFTMISFPFILETATKTMSMFYDNRVNQIRERRRVLNRIRHDIEAYENGEETEFSPDEQLPSPYLILCVRREFIVEDALFKLELVAAERPADLRKQLCIEFQGEEGVDEGGVSKEFFRLIIERVFSPDYGLFIFDDETDYFWFNPYPPIFGSEEEKEYMLIGMLFGLAIYNNITMDVHFPPVLFKKILGFDGLFEDLEHTHPSIYRSLITLLQYDSTELSIEDCFCLSYEVSSKTVFGQTVNHSLIQYGAEIPITEENRSDFVFRYSDWLLNKSIKKQFNAFLRGFELVTDESPLKVLFRPQQLEHLVCGEREYDWDKLREGCRYEGFSEFDKTIRLFWEVFDALSVEKRKKLLEFFTGSDRCPVGGLAKLKMTITKNGPESSRLPSAHTCFNILLLPEYQSKEILEERLLKALDNSIGFGMI